MHYRLTAFSWPSSDTTSIVREEWCDRHGNRHDQEELHKKPPSTMAACLHTFHSLAKSRCRERSIISLLRRLAGYGSSLTSVLNHPLMVDKKIYLLID